MGNAQRANDKDTSKIRRLIFTDEVLLFKMLYEAFLTRGSNRERRVSPEDKRSEARILRALKSISDPIGPDPNIGDPDSRQRTLKEDGGILELKGQDYNKLLRYAQESQNPSGLADVFDDLEQFLLKAEKLDSLQLAEELV